MRTSARCNQAICSGVQMVTQSTQTDDCEVFPEEWDNWLKDKVVEADTVTQEVPKDESCNGSEPVFVNLGQCGEAVEPGKILVPPHSGDGHDKECERCRQALGMRRPHRHGQSTSENVLSADLSGPHPEAIGTQCRYMLVAVFNAGKGKKSLPFVRGLKAKAAEEVKPALRPILGELNSMLG